MNSCSDVLIDLEYRAWLADPEGYEAEQAELQRWHDDSDVIRQWMEETEQAEEQESE